MWGSLWALDGHCRPGLLLILLPVRNLSAFMDAVDEYRDVALKFPAVIAEGTSPTERRTVRVIGNPHAATRYMSPQTA
jgi:hypothetical protein